MLHPPVKEKIFNRTVFRNDDVSYDSNLGNFKKINDLFHKYGFVQLHGIILYGKSNDILIVNGMPWKYEEIGPEDMYDYEKCVSVSTDYIGNNTELVDYINSIPDPIALHGLYHSDYSRMTYEQQDADISEGIRLLKELFPTKKIDTFIAPFNHTNADTYKICQKYGLRVSELEGEHLEDRLHNGKGPIYDGELYRYHHHRFYPESTFSYYDLSLEKLDKYLKHFSYTYIDRTERALPSSGLYEACCEMFNDDSRSDFSLNKAEVLAENSIKRYINYSDKLLQIESKKGKLLHYLWAQGYSEIYALENKEVDYNISDKVSKMLGTDIHMFNSEKACIECSLKFDAIVYISDKNTKYSIYEIFDFGTKIMNKLGYFIFVNPCIKEEKLIDMASKFNAMLVEGKPYSQKDCLEKIYVFKRIQPKICLLCDRPNWAFDNSAKELRKYLSDEFDIEIKYVIDKENINVDTYDIFQVFFWGEDSYRKNYYSKSRIIKQVCSHRWQFDKPYGPISVNEFVNKYLSDASTVMCPSEILYRTLQPMVKNIFLCGEGFSSDMFKCNNIRKGEISFCMVGNLTDPVKGVEDLLKPATEGYKLDLAQNLQHEELLEFYNAHDIYVVASRHEANPLPLIEAMACGCFPISSPIGIAPEIIRHKENGYLVENRTIEEFREAVEWCNSNLMYIRKKSKLIAKEIKRKREWKIMAENYRLMYRDHIGRR